MRFHLACLLIAALALAGCSELGSGGQENTYGQGDAESGAAFRFHARDVVSGLNLVCPFTADAKLLGQYDPLKDRFAALKDSVKGRPLATDLASVEADYEYYWTQNSAECGPVDGEGTEERVAQEIARIDQQLQQLERIAGGI